jgi:uncharacterized protein (DUF362 family)
LYSEVPRVSIVKTEGDLYEAFARAIDTIGVKLIVPGDYVLIKPNLVMPATPDSGEITNPKVIDVVARYCLDHGAARVIIGEGPSCYIQESCLRDCFTRTGVSELAERLGIEWVLFDEHGYRTFEGVSRNVPKKFRITEFAFTCDKFINLPVLKTHYLTTVTLAMKNLKGCLKREDKKLFHQYDVSEAVTELCKIVKPTVNVIDWTAKAIVRQLGDGYISEANASGNGLLIAGTDILAVDVVGCAIMGIEPTEVPTVSLGATARLGESEITRIDIVSEEIKRFKIKVEVPRERLRNSFSLLEIIGAERACSGCLIPLISSLLFLQEQGVKLDKPMAICLGENTDIPRDKISRLFVGDCSRIKDSDERNWVPGCPPDKEILFGSLIRHIVE